MISEKVMLGEIDGKNSQRLKQIADAFKKAGFPVDISKNIDAWKRCHVALVGPFANAVYMAGSCNYRLAQNKEAVKKTVHAIREGLNVIRANGFPIEPSVLKYAIALPDFIIVPMFQKKLGTKLMDIGGARHSVNAREEVIQLS